MDDEVNFWEIAWYWLSWYGSHTRSGHPFLMKPGAVDIYTACFTWSDTQRVHITSDTSYHDLLVTSPHGKRGDPASWEMSRREISHKMKETTLQLLEHAHTLVHIPTARGTNLN